MQKFDRQELVKNLEKFHQTNEAGFEVQCGVMWNKMLKASSSGQRSIEHPLGVIGGIDTKEFAAYIKKRFPESDGYQHKYTIGHITGCGCPSHLSPCTDIVIIQFL